MGHSERNLEWHSIFIRAPARVKSVALESMISALFFPFPPLYLDCLSAYPCYFWNHLSFSNCYNQFSHKLSLAAINNRYFFFYFPIFLHTNLTFPLSIFSLPNPPSPNLDLLPEAIKQLLYGILKVVLQRLTVTIWKGCSTSYSNKYPTRMCIKSATYLPKKY